MADGTLRGRLLVATPPLADPNFDRTVVLLLDHGPEGALGVVLNRPTGTSAGEVLPSWAAVTAEPRLLFAGGPVEGNAIIGVGRLERTEGADAIGPGLTTVDLSEEPWEHEPPVAQVRLFAGYAGWGPRQLEGELTAGAWLVVEAEPGDAFRRGDGDDGDDWVDMWRAVLARQGGQTAWMAAYPADPSLN